jgi:hypothetical protein
VGLPQKNMMVHKFVKVSSYNGTTHGYNAIPRPGLSTLSEYWQIMRSNACESHSTSFNSLLLTDCSVAFKHTEYRLWGGEPGVPAECAWGEEVCMSEPESYASLIGVPSVSSGTMSGTVFWEHGRAIE